MAATVMFGFAQKILSWRLFKRADDTKSFLEIFKWWELRRIPYNLIVGVAGGFSCVIVLALATAVSTIFNEPIGSSFLAAFSVLLFGVGANVCYTGGWFVEWIVRKIWRERAGAFGEISFFVGLVFSVLLALAPAAIFTLLFAIRMVLRR